MSSTASAAVEAQVQPCRPRSIWARLCHWKITEEGTGGMASLHLGRQRRHARLHEGLYVVLAEVEAVCYLLKVGNRHFAGPLIAFCYPQWVDAPVKQHLSLQAN